MNDSSTGGILTNSTPALNDVDLDTVFQTLFSAITGLNSDYVRPRFTPEPQTPPDFGATWCAVGVTNIRDADYPAQTFIDGVGMIVERHEYLDVLCSFYGLRAQQAMRTASDSILIYQNNEDMLTNYGIIFSHYDQPIKAPQLQQNRWVNRIDRTFTFRRQIVSTYNILSILDATGTISDGTLSISFDAAKHH